MAHDRGDSDVLKVVNEALVFKVIGEALDEERACGDAVEVSEL